MFNPISTYRIQFHAGFTFTDFEGIIPYLQKLGIKTIYASPIFEAVPGSTHGYDGLHPHRINPEIGTEAELRAIHQKLVSCDMAWIQDIVPNHMAFHPSNEWLGDLLEKGDRSPYFSFFDVEAASALTDNKLMVPFLGASAEAAIQQGEIKIEYENRLVLKYYDSSYPLHPQSYAAVLWQNKETLPAGLEELLANLGEVMETEDVNSFAERWQAWLFHLNQSVPMQHYLQSCIKTINSNPEALQWILDQQVYQLCHWQQTDHQINYRRFFTVNGLICLNMQDQMVFDQYHQLILTLVKEGIFQGLRIDHIDGLYDPSRYLEQLREAVGPDVYIVVEKILEINEKLPAYWQVQGNTGYDFLAMVNNLFTNAAAKPAFTQYYYNIAGDQRTVQQQVRDSKSYILHHHMAGELENLCVLFFEQDLLPAEFVGKISVEQVKSIIAAFLIFCPVYRWYSNSLPLLETEAYQIQQVLSAIRQTHPPLDEAVRQLEYIWLIKPNEGDEAFNLMAVHFFKRCMQFSGPLMAKGVEDTLMYTFNRFVAHNEVGDAVDAFGISPEAFHYKMIERQAQSPFSLNGTSTHDTKRGEDVRARLNVLTDLSEDWLKKVAEWQELNDELKASGVPDATDEYFIYQTLAGALPMIETGGDFGNRIEEYLQKALREAKRHSNWTTPNTAYESATKSFAAGLLQNDRPFWKSFIDFQKNVAHFGIVNSLSQLLLKFTFPGVPDIYQGCENWDFSMVDPDNRRPVDYKTRQQWLESFDAAEEDELLTELWENRRDGRIKLWLTQKLLHLRLSHTDLFSDGDYIPLKTSGKFKENVMAFARQYGKDWIIVVVPLHTAVLGSDPDWEDTKVVLPATVSPQWDSLLIRQNGEAASGILVKDVLSPLPFALLQMQAKGNERSAGVLLHISSLPSLFGIGDLGPEAYSFILFLSKARQKYWQLLPINPTEAGQGHSPYSSISSRAGNTLFISPELLANEGLLQAQDFTTIQINNDGQVDYEKAEAIKKSLFDIAWQHFQTADQEKKSAFKAFCQTEQDWLDDFALYMVFKEQFGGKPWYEWPEKLRTRSTKDLTSIKDENKNALDKQKWLQFIFYRQWAAFKKSCNAAGIKLIGDLPFYVSYDSADVWANQHLFNIDENGQCLGIAGVPPDAFSSDGQLWGMPVFKWEAMKEDGYSWWIERLRKNTALFDLVRLDHFRAFADYWEVPASATTAKEGVWKAGPGSQFFTTVKEALGDLLFIAEDLGEINDAVLELRDEFGLPGMKILQFAFGEDLPSSSYIPHNYSPNFIVYTGTHDNNTTKGWYRQETDEDMRHQINRYVGQEVTEDTIACHLSRQAYASVAKTVIVPMQDWLNLDESARMNTPASSEQNWQWRLLPGQASKALAKQLKEWTVLFNRQ